MRKETLPRVVFTGLFADCTTNAFKDFIFKFNFEGWPAVGLLQVAK